MARARAAKTARAVGAPVTSPDRQGSLIWAQGLLCGAIVTLATPSAVLLVALLLPVALAYRLDHQPGRPMARAVLVCTIAVAIDPMWALWHNGNSLSLAMALLGDIGMLLPAWAAAAGGWLLAELAPIGVRAALEVTTRARAARLRAERARLEAEWGIPPADRPDG